ncbi:MAG: ABC transporter ATP-binding protein [Victivallaceae bacterium]|nr:ABC transporter ATP-binding protein [Victivallaceae bacterium]
MKIEIANLCFSYGREAVIAGADLTVESGTVIGLVGANGAGKTTLLKLIGRLIPADSGSIRLDGRDLRRFSGRGLARRRAFLPQLHTAPPDITVEELAAFGRFPYRSAWRPAAAGDGGKVNEAIALAGLWHLRHRRLGTLSGGERQRAWLSLALAQEPELLLLDEPATFLDPAGQFQVMELVARLNRELGITVVMVLHDLNFAVRCTQKIAALVEGRLVEYDDPAQILAPETLRTVFGLDAGALPGADGLPYLLPKPMFTK